MDQLRECTQDELNQAVAGLTVATKLAADFLATEVGAPRAEALPYTNQFAVLAEAFRNLPKPTAAQVKALREWFWRTTISTYFGGWNNSQMASDAKTVRSFARGSSDVIDFQWVTPTHSVWKNKPFRANSDIAKMLGLILGAAVPKDLLSGAVIDVDKSLAWSNDKEYHHFFPKTSWRGRNVSPTKSTRLQISSCSHPRAISTSAIRRRANT